MKVGLFTGDFIALRVGIARPRVPFDDGSEQTIDFRPILAGELYGPLRDLELFNRVAIDGEAHTLVWPNGADFAPEALYELEEEAASAKIYRRLAETAVLHSARKAAVFRGPDLEIALTRRQRECRLGQRWTPALLTVSW